MAVDDAKSLRTTTNEWIVKPRQAAKSPAQQGAAAGASRVDGSAGHVRDSDEGGAPKQLQAGLFPPQQLQPGLFPPPPAATCASTASGASVPTRSATQLLQDDTSEADGDDTPTEERPAFSPIGTKQEEQQGANDVDSERRSTCESAGEDGAEAVADVRFEPEETVLIFDWDDTVLPSTWVQCQGLRLDEGSALSDWQREQLVEVATVAAETLRIAKLCGTVVLVTNAERGWIELSCQKFLPTLLPSLENVKVLSARTTYESAEYSSPLDWKLRAFESEIRRVYGSAALAAPARRKNVLSLGDSVHEREALLRATSPLPNCRSKSLKFVERPDIAQICKQHSLVTSCFDRIVHHDGNLDLCIRCA